MKRILPAILIAAAGLGMLNAQTKVMTIEYKDGTKEIKKVTDVQRITFGDEAQVDPSDKMVDLGLSVKWAPFNIGATEPTSKGAYFSWGETRQKDYNHVYNYQWYDPITDSYVEIGDQISNTSHDAAKDLWGDGWRLPTEEEMKELVEQCTWEVSGYCYKVTGPNGNSIYLPGVGFSTYKGKPKAMEQSGYYWTGNADVRTNKDGKKLDSNAACLKFTRDTYKKTFLEPKMDFFSKAGGIQIRPVHE